MTDRELEYLLALAGALLLVLTWLRMRPRHYYFIRHGETVLNKQKIKQGPEGELSDAGKVQAAEVGAALAPLSIGLICSSPYTRAKETAEIIAKEVGRPRIRYSPLLAERKNPSEVIGRGTKDPEVVRIVDTIDLSYHEDDYRYSDEENFLDLRKRAEKCLRYLARQQYPQICVVTHHAFLKMLLTSMLYGQDFHAGDFIKLSFFNPSDNGGITLCTYRPWSRMWSVEGYNEKARKELSK